jgi:hypothetical protein
MCIRFGHPTKKNELVCCSLWEAAMAGVVASMGTMGSSPKMEGREKGKRVRGSRCGVPWGGGGQQEGAPRGLLSLLVRAAVLRALCFVLNVR